MSAIADITAGPAILKLDQRAICVGDQCEHINQRQMFAIAERLMRNHGSVVSQDDLIAALWPNPDDEPEWPVVEIRDRVRRFRDLISRVTKKRLSVVAVYGVGYRLEVR